MVKIRTQNRKSSHTTSHARLPLTKDSMSSIALGAAVGCAIGATAALLLTPKQKGNKFSQKLNAIYDHLSDVADEYGHGALEKGRGAYKAARNSAENIYSAAAHAFEKNGKHSNRNLILGIIGTGLLGASAVYALTQNSSRTQSFADRWKLNKWPEMAQLVVDTISTNLQEGAHSKSHAENSHNPLHNVFDWAVIGLNLWQEIKKRRSYE